MNANNELTKALIAKVHDWNTFSEHLIRIDFLVQHDSLFSNPSTNLMGIFLAITKTFVLIKVFNVTQFNLT